MADNPVEVLRHFLKMWMPVLAWMTVIFVASSGLGAPTHTSGLIEPLLRLLHCPEHLVPTAHFFVRKLGHFVEYAILAGLLWRSFRAEAFVVSSPLSRQILLVMSAAAFWAASDELHQFFVATRQCSVHDVILDSCGAAFGVMLAWGIGRWRT